MFGIKKVKDNPPVFEDGLSYFITNIEQHKEIVDSKFYDDLIKNLENYCYNHIEDLKKADEIEFKFIQGKIKATEDVLSTLKKFKGYMR